MAPPPDEQAVLGAALAGRAGHAGVLSLSDADWADPRHRRIATVMQELIRRNHTLDVTVVADELASRSQLRDAGGSLYLTDLLSAAPVPAMGTWYADRVRAAARVRTAAGAAETLTEGLRSEGAEARFDELLAAHSATLASVPPALRSDEEALPTVRRLLAKQFSDEAWIIPGLLERQERVMITGGEGQGKRLRVDEPIPTPTGWTTMGQIKPGDQVISRDGKPCNVSAVSAVDPFPDAWAVVFDDGTVIEADADHQWVTVDYRSRQRDHQAAVRTTAQIRDTLTARDGHVTNHAVPVAAPLDLPSVALPVDPYLLGVWLGDGSTAGGLLTLNRLDAPEIEAHVATSHLDSHRVPSSDRSGSVGVRIDGFKTALSSLGVVGFKHVPDVYLRGSIEQRTALLAGLMDTDGYCLMQRESAGRGSGAATCELTFTCKTLIPGVLELIRSLGIKVHMSESDAVLEGRVVGRRWRMTFQSPFNPFRVARKADRWTPLKTRRSQYRYVVEVKRAEPTPMRCISVDSPDRTYLAGRRMVPTHNSTLLKQIGVSCAAGLNPWNGRRVAAGARVLYVDAELSERQNARAYAMMKSRVSRHPLADPGWQDNLNHFVRNDGVDLAGRDREWFHHIANRISPDVIIVGPVYKLINGSESDQEIIAGLQRVLDEVRVQHDAALIIETHSPHGTDEKTRPVRPVGSSLWLRWPEIGFGFRRDTEANVDQRDDVDEYLKVVAWRGQRDARDWPDLIQWGSKSQLPWVPTRPDWRPSVDTGYTVPKGETA